MKRCKTWVGILLLAGTLVSCGGGGGGDSPSTPATNSGATPPSNAGTPPNSGATPPNSGGTPPSNPVVSTPGRFEESDAAVSLSAGHWTPTNNKFGWSGGTAMQSSMAGATATFTFTGTSVRWIGARNEDSGVALVSVDGGPGKRVDLFARPNEIRTPIITLDGLTPGTHTLTIQVTGEKSQEAHSASAAVVVVDAFDVEAPIVSHLQETDPDVAYSGTWTQDPSAAWSGGGVATVPDPPHGGARFTTTAGDKITLTFRGTSITWQSGRGPDFGIATVQVDGGAPTEVDTYSPATKFQEVVFKAAGLADATHKLTITATGRKNAASTSPKVVVDAFDVTTPGTRHQQDDPKITYTGKWTPHNVNRVWNEGACATSNVKGSRAIFTFTGTGVSWIGCQKESCSGVAKVFVDGAFKQQINNWRPVPVEAYQHDIFRVDGLTPGVHTLMIEQQVDTGYIVVDAFDVRP